MNFQVRLWCSKAVSQKSRRSSTHRDRQRASLAQAVLVEGDVVGVHILQDLRQLTCM